MSEVLEQSDIDALLNSLGGPTSSKTEEEKHAVFTRRPSNGEYEIKDYDFKRPERVSKDQMRALQTLHEAFARNFGASLSGFLRTIVEVKVATCEQMTYSEFISGLPNPTSFNLIEAEGLTGQICLEISPLIIYPIIDRLLGGNSADLFIPQRPTTAIENRLIGNVTSRGLSALAEAWSAVHKLDFQVSATESNPQLVQIVPPNEVVIVIGFELKMTNRAGTMNLCIPYNSIEGLMEELSNQSWFAQFRGQREPEAERRLTKALSHAGLGVQVMLAETTISLHDLLVMKPGDVISTERLATKPVVVCVEGEKKYLADVGQHRGNRAIKILRSVGLGDAGRI